MMSFDGVFPNTCFRVGFGTVYYKSTIWCNGEKDKTHSKIDINKLIIEVEETPSLYNAEHPSYRDAEKSANLWTAIGTILEAPGRHRLPFSLFYVYYIF